MYLPLYLYIVTKPCNLFNSLPSLFPWTASTKQKGYNFFSKRNYTWSLLGQNLCPVKYLRAASQTCWPSYKCYTTLPYRIFKWVVLRKENKKQGLIQQQTFYWHCLVITTWGNIAQQAPPRDLCTENTESKHQVWSIYNISMSKIISDKYSKVWGKYAKLRCMKHFKDYNSI